MVEPKRFSLTKEEQNLLLNKRSLLNSYRYLADLVEGDCKRDVEEIRQRLAIPAEDNVVLDLQAGTLEVHAQDPKAGLEKRGFVLPGKPAAKNRENGIKN